jgi:hypothetical protein
MVGVSVGTEWVGLGWLLPTKVESACWFSPAGSRPARNEGEVFLQMMQITLN